MLRVTADNGERGEEFLRNFRENEKAITTTVLIISQKLSTSVGANAKLAQSADLTSPMYNASNLALGLHLLTQVGQRILARYTNSALARAPLQLLLEFFGAHSSKCPSLLLRKKIFLPRENRFFGPENLFSNSNRRRKFAFFHHVFDGTRRN